MERSLIRHKSIFLMVGVCRVSPAPSRRRSGADRTIASRRRRPAISIRPRATAACCQRQCAGQVARGENHEAAAAAAATSGSTTPSAAAASAAAHEQLVGASDGDPAGQGKIGGGSARPITTENNGHAVGVHSCGRSAVTAEIADGGDIVHDSALEGAPAEGDGVAPSQGAVAADGNGVVAGADGDGRSAVAGGGGVVLAIRGE